jgi:hypothetical protein
MALAAALVACGASTRKLDEAMLFQGPRFELKVVRYHERLPLHYVLVQRLFCKSAPKLAEWMEANVPEGLTVFALPEPHRRRLRTTNALERLNRPEFFGDSVS